MPSFVFLVSAASTFLESLAGTGAQKKLVLHAFSHINSVLATTYSYSNSPRVVYLLFLELSPSSSCGL